MWLYVHAELQQMLTQGGGKVINMASALSKRMFDGASLYVASKFAVAGMTRTATVGYSRSGIRNYVICPGMIRIPLLESQETDEDEMQARQAMHRLGTPEEIANAVLWVVSNKASFCTGSLLSVGGGWRAG